MKPGVTTRVVSVVLAFFFIAPTAVVAGSSFTSSRLVQFPPDGFSTRWYEEVLHDPDWTAALGHSLVTGLIAAALAAVVGTCLALTVARGTGIPKGVVMALATTPLVVPLVIAGLGFYLVFVKIGLTGNVLGLGIAHSVLGIPFVFVNVLARLTALDRRVEDAARICGANELKTFFLVTLPLIGSGAVIGGLFAFISSWDEVVVANFMATPDFHTVPIQIFGQLREGVQPSTSAVATMVTAFSLVILALIALSTLLRRARPWARNRRTTS